MSDLRQDPVTGQWVAISEVRATRPNEFRQVETRHSNIGCPFCPGNESQTPDPVAVYDQSGSITDLDTADWLVRVIPNKFPAIFHSSEQRQQPIGPYVSVVGAGQQEIVVQSARHVVSTSELTPTELAASFLAYQDRVRAMRRTPGIKHVMLFKNCRAEAGASLEHVHSQLIGTPIVSEQLKSRVARADDFYNRERTTIIQKVVDWEREQGERIVADAGSFVAFCPYASRFSDQIWIAPTKPTGDFWESDEATTVALATLTQNCIDRLERALNYPAYNILFHFPPFGDTKASSFQWYLEIVPRQNRIAGYELGTGCWINDTDPIAAANRLKNVPPTPS